MFRKLICKGICIVFSFSILKPVPSALSASLDLVDRVVHTENRPAIEPMAMISLPPPRMLTWLNVKVLRRFYE